MQSAHDNPKFLSLSAKLRQKAIPFVECESMDIFILRDFSARENGERQCVQCAVGKMFDIFELFFATFLYLKTPDLFFYY